jgi:hypothetical protein
MAARLVRALGARSVWVSAVAAIFAVCCLPFMSRLGHTALSGHFLILWALSLYWEDVRQGRPTVAGHILLSCVTLLTNPYLFVMVSIVQMGTVLSLWRRGQLNRQHVGAGSLGVLAVVAIALLAGYGAVVADPSSVKSGGFGYFSWNPVTLVVPPERYWGFPRGITRDATGGQYEGETYIGLGAVLIAFVCAAVWPRRIWERLREHSVLAVVLLILAAFAATHRVYVGKTLVLSYSLPGRLEDLANSFRASGRFIWPLAYCLMLVPLACLWRWSRPAVFLSLVLLAVVLQSAEASHRVKDLRAATAKPVFGDLIDARNLAPWMKEHRRLWQYPSWSCGGLAPPRRFGDVESNRELQVELLAARLNIPSNSVYMSRVLKDCAAESSWADHPRLEEDVLYLLAPGAVLLSPSLSAMAASPACRSLSWAVVCSGHWTTAGRNDQPGRHEVIGAASRR